MEKPYDFIDERRFRLLESRMRGNSSDFMETNSSHSEQDNSSNASSTPKTTPPAEKRKKRKLFTTEEDELIIQGYKMYVDNWDKIIEHTKLQRTAQQIKSRFNRIRHKYDLDMEPSPAPKRQKIRHEAPVDEQSKEEKLAAELLETQKLLKKRDNEIQLLEQKNRKNQDTIESMAKIIKNQAAELEKQEIVDQPEDFYRDLLQKLITKNAELDYQLRRHHVWENTTRLGKIVVKQHGHTIIEDWEDGLSFQELDVKRKLLSVKKEKLENKRKEITKAKSSLKAKLTASTSESPLSREYDQSALREEVLRNQIASLKKEEQEITAQYQKLIIERNFHRKQCKLVYDQENSSFNQHPLLHHRYVLENLLGRGGFSEVYAAFDLVARRTVACKIFQLSSSWSKQKQANYQKHALREYQIQKSICHDRVVRLFDVFELSENENSFCTVLEYCNDGDLDSRLRERNKLPEKEVRCIITQILEGLKYLNRLENPIIHFDLKPGNILFHHGEVKITDFGLSKIVDNSDGMVDLTSQGAGTCGYLPPECSSFPMSKISSKVDVWSLGVICFQMLFGKKPFDSAANPFRKELEFPGKISDDCKVFIQQCLTRNQMSRPDVFDIANLPFVNPK